MHSKAARMLPAIVAAVLSTAMCAYAQPGAGGGRQGARGGGGMGRMGGRNMTAASVPVDVLTRSLGLTADQAKRIGDIQTNARTQMRSVFQGMRGGGGRPDQATMQANMQKMQAMGQKVDTDIHAVLTSGQKARLPALLKQWQTLRSAGIPIQVAPDLKLTAAQTTKLDAISAAARAKMQAAMPAGGGPGGGGAPGAPGGRGSGMRQIFQDARAQAAAVLTPAQKAIVDKYEKDHPRPAFGGGAGGGRGRGAGGGRGRGAGAGGPGGAGA